MVNNKSSVKTVRIRIGKRKYTRVHVKNIDKFIKDMKKKKIIKR